MVAFMDRALAMKEDDITIPTPSYKSLSGRLYLQLTEIVVNEHNTRAIWTASQTAVVSSDFRGVEPGYDNSLSCWNLPRLWKDLAQLTSNDLTTHSA